MTEMKNSVQKLNRISWAAWLPEVLGLCILMFNPQVSYAIQFNLLSGLWLIFKFIFSFGLVSFLQLAFCVWAIAHVSGRHLGIYDTQRWTMERWAKVLMWFAAFEGALLLHMDVSLSQAIWPGLPSGQQLIFSVGVLLAGIASVAKLAHGRWMRGRRPIQDK